jgi:hypothetical protein
VNPQKSQLKMLIANELGADIEDRREGQIKTAHELDGSCAALKQAAKKVPSTFMIQVEKDMDEGKIKDGMTALEIVELVKKYLLRTGDYLGHLSEVAGQEAVAQHGRAAGIKDAMDAIAAMRDKESAKLQQALSMVEEVPEAPRTSASAARMERGSLAERRKKPAKKIARKKAAKKASKKAHG